MRALGRAAKNCRPVVFFPFLPTFARCGRADAGFGFHPGISWLEQRPAQYAVAAPLTTALKPMLGGLHYERLNARWEIAEFEHRLTGWPSAGRCVAAGRKMEETEPEPALFALDRYLYRAWLTNLSLTPAGVWNFYQGRAGMEPPICQLREYYALPALAALGSVLNGS
jgi:hypothetical protein